MSTNAVKVSSGFTQYPFNTHIGEAGRLFYNAATGELRLSDGHTPGGVPVYTAVGAANIGNLVKPILLLVLILPMPTSIFKPMAAASSTW